MDRGIDKIATSKFTANPIEVAPRNELCGEEPTTNKRRDEELASHGCD